MHLNILLIPILLTGLIDKASAVAKCSGSKCNCPETQGEDVVRITGTRFVMLNKNKELASFAQAKTKCITEGWSLAQIRTIEEDTTIGRWLENYAANHNLTDTNWWIDAEYNKVSKLYVTSDGDPITYQNFIFKTYPLAADPKDLTEYNITGEAGEVISPETATTCATISLPFSYTGSFGSQYSWREMDCGINRRVLCQATTNCDDYANQWQLTQKRYDGWFPLSGRKYLLNWRRMTKDEAQQACSSVNLVMYDPHKTQDLCLLNLIKRHRREVTHTSLWTGWTYNLDEREFFDIAGNQRGSFGIRIVDTRTSVKKAKKTLYCVSLLYAFEHQNSCNCPWKFVQTVPTQCDLVNGAMCSATLHKKLPCIYDKVFPLKEESNVFRSDDKMDYPSAETECRRYGLTLVDYKFVEEIKFEHEYDKQVQYWVYADQAEDDSCKTAEFRQDPGWKWVYTNDQCSQVKFFLCSKNKGSSAQTGRMLPKFLPENDVSHYNKKSDSVEDDSEYFVGEKATFKRSKHNCHKRGMDLLSADEPDNLDFLETTAAELNATFWIYSKHVDKANEYRYHEEETKQHQHNHVCITMNRNGVPKASNCKFRHRYICTQRY